MRPITYLLLLLSTCTHADTIDNFMNIANNIPQMEMKADPQAQAWARSARNILVLTSESVSESLLLANESAKEQGKAFFCLPPSVQLNASMVNDLIQQTYREISSQQSDKDKMTVSQVALLGLRKQYPCSPQQSGSVGTQQNAPQSTQQMMHMGN